MDLTGLCWSVIEEGQRQEPWRHIDWVIMEKITATGDPILLRSVLENLIGSAWKFTGNLHHLRIEFGVT